MSFLDDIQSEVDTKMPREKKPVFFVFFFSKKKISSELGLSERIRLKNHIVNVRQLMKARLLAVSYH